MFDRLIANRTLLTWVTMLSLTGSYLVYAQVLQQVINGTVVRQEFPEEVFQSPEYASANNEHAKTYLPEIPWAADARYQFKDENVFIYTERWQQEEEKRAARLKPFAMLMFDPKKKDSEKPFALMSEEALIRFEQPFGIKQTDPGHMIAGSLEGFVKITGPNGLIIYGRNFFYDESSMNIWSDSEVRFAYEEHRGRARGIEMKLIPAAGSPKSKALEALLSTWKPTRVHSIKMSASTIPLVLSMRIRWTAISCNSSLSEKKTPTIRHRRQIRNRATLPGSCSSRSSSLQGKMLRWSRRKTSSQAA